MEAAYGRPIGGGLPTERGRSNGFVTGQAESAPQRAGDVLQAVNDVNAAMIELEDVVEQVGRRLIPFARQVPTDKDRVNVSIPAECAFSGEVRGMAVRVSQNTQRLRDLLDRLEI